LALSAAAMVGPLPTVNEPMGVASVEDIVAAAESVPGWTEPDDARAIVHAVLGLPAGPRIAEIGVFLGRCTALLAGACRLRGDGRVHCVDPFDCSGDAFSVPHYEAGLRETGLASLEEAFRRNMARLGLLPWIAIHPRTDLTVAAQWSGPLDLLLLDADQSPRGARAAYDAWLPFLKEGGTIVLRNTRDRTYAEGHDGHRRLVVEELHAPRFRDVRQLGATTLAIRATAGR
jgi:predicted O-methyltransferase YrrM